MLAGAIVGFVFDFYRSLRKWLDWGRVMTIVGDLIFSGITLILCFELFLRANELEFRFYILWGSLLGLLGYMRLLSPIIIKLFRQLFYFINVTWRFLLSIMYIPVKIIILVMKPFYRVLQWFSLLVFRMAESVLDNPLRKAREKTMEIWEHFFPPRTNG